MLRVCGISVNGRNLLAFDAASTWDINRIKGAGMVAGGVFNTTVSGSGGGGGLGGLLNG